MQYEPGEKNRQAKESLHVSQVRKHGPKSGASLSDSSRDGAATKEQGNVVKTAKNAALAKEALSLQWYKSELLPLQWLRALWLAIARSSEASLESSVVNYCASNTVGA